MVYRLFVAALVALALLALTSLACGPTAGQGNAPQSSPGDTASSEEATPTPTSPPPADTPTPLPTKPPLPTQEIPSPIPPKLPLVTPQPSPTPILSHPGGMEACHEWTIFSPSEDLKYLPWCTEGLEKHVSSTCSERTTTETQLACGREVVSDYKSFSIKESPYKCFGLPSGSEAIRECVEQSGNDIDKAFEKVWEASAKVQIGADGDAEVVRAMKDVTTCLEELGYEKVNLDLLFSWQRFDDPRDLKERESRLTEADKELRAELREPSQSCAKKNGLFDAQDAAWISELERLAKKEPETVQILIGEGLLEALKKPGTEIFLTGDRPS